MSHQRPTAESPVFTSLGETRRQHTLRVLCDRASPIELRELATHLAATGGGKALLDVTADEVDSIRTSLVHVHLPKLEAADLVDWDRSADAVTTTDHPALDDPKFQQLVNTDAPGWEAVVNSLASARRRVVLSVLKDDGELSRADLAERVLAREHDGNDDVLDTVDDVLTGLHHSDLPRLQQAGLVAYDADSGAVSYEGHEALDEEWLDFRPGETPRAILPSAHRSEDIWTVEGRENVIARGQSLMEQADDELFLMFTTEGLLEDGCIRRLQDAVDRGVDVYLGSQTPAVRDCVREHVPEATIWEPQMDWLNLPPEYEKVGRLVMADREAIMLGTLGEETGDGVHHEETAITGSDENNPLVMLLRELLGSRLDHLDAQSEDFLAEIPL